MPRTTIHTLAILLCLIAHVVAGSGAFVLCDGMNGHFALETTHTTKHQHDDHQQPCSDTGYDVIVTANRRSDVVQIDFDAAPLLPLAPAIVATAPMPPAASHVLDTQTPAHDSITCLQTVVLLI